MKKPWKNKLAVKLFLSYFALIFLFFTFVALYSGTLLREFYIASLSKRMQENARLVGRLLPFGLEGAALDKLSRELAGDLNARITVIALGGKVLGDSSQPSRTMENHATRPEVLAALSRSAGTSLRHSTTVGYDMLYHAILQRQGDAARIVRISIPTEDIEEAVGSLRRALFVGLAAASALGLLAAFWFSRRIGGRVQRMAAFSQVVARGEFPATNLAVRSGDELSVLEKNLNELSASIHKMIKDITAEKEKAESILTCMSEGVLVVTPEGDLILLNLNARRMFGLPPDQDFYGRPIAEISRHPEMKRLMEQVARCDCSRECFTKELSLGEGRWFRVSAVSLRQEDESLAGYILVFHDVTELKRLETVRSDFVANVSHELRTPLTAIRGYVETLLHSPPENPAEARNFLAVIQRHSERLGRLVDDLLTLSDLESGRIRMAKVRLSIDEPIRRVLEIFQEQATKKKIALIERVKPHLPPVVGDPDRLQQIFINLIDNAVKYTPEGGSVTIAARLAPRAEVGDWPMMEIAVADTGIGIPENDLSRLTERFYRVDKARSRELGGTGLGLAIVKHIVEVHEGAMKIESRLRQGTTVRVFLPVFDRLESASQPILFLCTANSCRSQMAEGFARRLAPNGSRIYSAGTEPKDVHPLAVRVMDEIGVDISAQRSKGLNAVPLDEIRLLVTLCGDAAEGCPTLPRDVEHIHWPLRDPVAASGSTEDQLKVFREVRDEIRGRVEALFAARGAAPPGVHDAA